jgi:hypothetical protein
MIREYIENKGEEKRNKDDKRLDMLNKFTYCLLIVGIMLLMAFMTASYLKF